MRLFHRSGVCALALVAGAAALQFEPTVLRDLAFDNGSQHVSVGAVRTSLWSAAFAQSTENFSLDNVSFSFGGASYEAKRIELTGVTSSRAEIEALFSSNSAEPLASRLGRINAKQITIPEIRATQKLGSDVQSIIYKNAVLSNIVQGRINSFTIDETRVEAGKASKDNNLMDLRYGRISTSAIDMPAYARIFEMRAESDNAPMTKLYDSFSIENVEASNPQEGVKFRIARIGGRDFMARPTKNSWSGAMEVFTELGGKKDLNETEQERLVATVFDFLSAFDIGNIEATGIDLLAMPSKGKDADKGKASPVSASIARIAYTGTTGAQPADMRVEGMEISEPDGHVKIATISLTGFSFAPTIHGLKNLQSKPLKDLDPKAARQLVPTLGTLRISGFDIDTVSREEGKEGERVKAAFKDFEITADKPINGVPTIIRIALQNFAVTLPENSKEEGIQSLLDLGYENIDISLALAAEWNEATNEITIKEVSAQGQDMGSIVLKGRLANVTREVFDADMAVASAALLGAKAMALDVSIENKGLFERYLEQAAEDEHTKPEALRKSYASAAPAMASAFLGPSEQAKNVGRAVAHFIAKPGRLTINAQPKNPDGLGVTALIMLSEPAAIVDKLNITAKAE